MNLVVAKEGETKGEQEGENVYNDTDPYAYDLNESKMMKKTCH